MTALVPQTKRFILSPYLPVLRPVCAIARPRICTGGAVFTVGLCEPSSSDSVDDQSVEFPVFVTGHDVVPIEPQEPCPFAGRLGFLLTHVKSLSIMDFRYSRPGPDAM